MRSIVTLPGLHYFLWSLLSLSLFSCGSSREESAFFPQSPRKPIEENLHESKLNCDDPKNCSPAVGMILSYQTLKGQEGVARCTGFLISSTIVATNSHCIPEGVKADSELCSEHLGIVFPSVQKEGSTAGGSEQTSRRCKRLLHHTQIAKEGETEHIQKTDLALFELESPIERPNLALSRSGIFDQQKLQFSAVDPVRGSTPAGIIRSSHCIAIKGSSYIKGDASENSQVAVLFGPDCKSKPGNSGSPIMTAEDGRVVALLHGGLNPDFRLEEHMERPTFVSNLRCVNWPEKLPILLNERPESCDRPIEALPHLKWSEDSIRIHFRQTLNAWRRSLNSDSEMEIDYNLSARFHEERSTAVVTRKSLCIKAPLESPKNTQHVLERSLPIFSTGQALDRYGRRQLRIQQMSSYRWQVRLKLKQENFWDAEEIMIFPDGTKRRLEVKVPVCSI